MIESIITDLAEKGWCVAPGFLSSGLVHKLAQEAEQLYQDGALHPAAIGKAEQRQILSTLRGDSIFWLDEERATPAQAEFFAQMDELRLAVNRELQLGLFELEVHFARYPAGAGYEKHLDVFQKDSRRTLTIICYLNESWQPEQGGQLRMELEDGGSTDIQPEGGTLVCFLSHRFPHEVMPATRTRQSITGWFKRR